MEKIQKYKKIHDAIFQSVGGGQARHKHGGQGLIPGSLLQCSSLFNIV